VPRTLPIALVAALASAAALAPSAHADVGDLTFQSCLNSAAAAPAPCTTSPYVHSPTDVAYSTGLALTSLTTNSASSFNSVSPSFFACMDDGAGLCTYHTNAAIDAPQGLAGPTSIAGFVTGDANNAIVSINGPAASCAAQDGALGCSVAHGMHHPRHVAFVGTPVGPYDQVYVATGDGIAWFAADVSKQYALAFGGCVNADGSDACTKANVANESSIAIAPDAASVYVGSPDGSITAFQRADGALSQVGCITKASPAPVGCVTGLAIDSVDGLAISPDGHDLYAVSTTDDSVVDFTRAANGSITESACWSSRATGSCADGGFSLRKPDSVAVAPDGDDVYVGNSLTQVTTLARDATGALHVQGCAGPSACSAADTPTNSPGAIAINFDGTAVYAASRDANQLTTYTRAAPAADLSIQATTPLEDMYLARVRTTLTITNHGPQAATGVTVTMLIAVANPQLITSRGSCSPVVGQIATCNIGTLAPGDSATVALSADGTSLAGVLARVSDRPAIHDPDSGNDMLALSGPPSTGSDSTTPPYTDPFGTPHRLRLSGVRAIPAMFAAAGAQVHRGKHHAHLGTRLRFTLSAAARVTIAITSAGTGRRYGTLIRQAHKGINSIAFSGRFNGRPLKPGPYRAAVHAEAPHLKSPGARILKLTVVKA